LNQPRRCPDDFSAQKARDEEEWLSYPFQISMDHAVLVDELETGSYIQELKIPPWVSGLGVKRYKQVLTNFAPRSGRSLAKERMLPDVIHWVIRDGKRGVEVTPMKGTTLG
jgi:hypothetical protein